MDSLSNGHRRFNVCAPEIDDAVVERPRLVDQVLAQLETGRIVDIVGVAGAGKTTLAAQAARRTPMPIAWLSLEEWDQSPSRFLEDLIDALTAVVPGLGVVLDPASADRPRALAAAAGGVLGARDALLVVDDAHLLTSWAGSSAVLGSLLRSSSGLRLVLVGRRRVMIPDLGTDELVGRALVGDEALAADLAEVAQILEARGSSADASTTAEFTQGWVAGVVLAASTGIENARQGLEAFLATTVRPRLRPAEDDFLLSCSVFDVVDVGRATAVAGHRGPELLAALRLAGVPAAWHPTPLRARLHPRIREALRAELDASPGRLARALAGARRAYEDEGALELALEAAIGAGETAEAQRLLPLVIGDVIGRLDVDSAHRLLAAVVYDEEPPAVLLARLWLALLAQQAEGALPALAALEEEGRFAEVTAALPEVGALACVFLAAIGRVDDAFARYAELPPSRAKDAARFYLSSERDDPDAPIPAFAGDVLDIVVCEGLYARGRIELLHGITSPALAAASGVPDLVDRAGGTRGVFAETHARLLDAVSRRDRAAARAVLHDLEQIEAGSHIFIGLVQAEIAARIERDPERVLAGLELARALPEAENVSYSEVIRMWEGLAHLLAGRDAEAYALLQETVADMRRGDRLLHLPATLAYLAEAAWRCGAEDEADRATADAYAIAREHALVSRLLLALADVPGVLSRALDLHPDVDGEWHALGRALVRGKGSTRPSSRAGSWVAVVHLRELGEPVLLVDGVPTRPKLRKSLEVLSYLLASPRAQARRREVVLALWGRDDEAARAYLRQAVRYLRDALPPAIELETRGDVLSVAGAITSEVGGLEALLRAAAAQHSAARLALLRQAISIGERGVYLEGSDGAWVELRRATLESALQEALLDTATTLLEESRLVEALETIDAALRRDPLLERGWRLRMRALGLLGDADGVTDALRACAAALGSVGLDPAPSTLEVARLMRR